MSDEEAPPPPVETPPEGAGGALTVGDVVDASPRTPHIATLGEGQSPSRKSFINPSTQSFNSDKTHNYDDLLSSMGAAQTSDDLDPEVMAADVEILKSRLKSMGKGLLDPRSQLMQYW